MSIQPSDFLTSAQAGLAQNAARTQAGWAAAAGGTKWDLLEKKAVLTVAAPAWTAIKGGAAPTHLGSLPLKAPTGAHKLFVVNSFAKARTALAPTVRLVDVLGYANFSTTITTQQNFTGFTLPRWNTAEGLQM